MGNDSIRPMQTACDARLCRPAWKEVCACLAVVIGVIFQGGCAGREPQPSVRTILGVLNTALDLGVTPPPERCMESNAALQVYGAHLARAWFRTCKDRVHCAGSWRAELRLGEGEVPVLAASESSIGQTTWAESETLISDDPGKKVVEMRTSRLRHAVIVVRRVP